MKIEQSVPYVSIQEKKQNSPLCLLCAMFLCHLFSTQRDRFWGRTLDCGPETEPSVAAYSHHASPWTPLSKRTSEIASAQNHQMQIQRSEILCAGILYENYFYQYMFDIGFLSVCSLMTASEYSPIPPFPFVFMTLVHLSKINVHAHL